MITTALQVIQRHGICAAWKLAGYRLLQRLMPLNVTYFMIQDLHEMPEVKSRSDVECRFLSATEVREFGQDPSNELPADIADRLENHHDLCFAGIVNGRLASYCWFALESIEADHNNATGNARCGIALSFPDEYVFRYKGFTHPDFRGRRIYSLLASEAAAELRQRGISFVLSNAEWTNFAAQKSDYRSGFQNLGIVVVAEIAKRRFVRYPSMTCEGIYFGEEAEVLDRSLLSPYQRYARDEPEFQRPHPGSVS